MFCEIAACSFTVFTIFNIIFPIIIKDGRNINSIALLKKATWQNNPGHLYCFGGSCLKCLGLTF